MTHKAALIALVVRGPLRRQPQRYALGDDGRMLIVRSKGAAPSADGQAVRAGIDSTRPGRHQLDGQNQFTPATDLEKVAVGVSEVRPSRCFQ